VATTATRPASPGAADTVDYEITVTNSGSRDAYGLVIEDIPDVANENAEVTYLNPGVVFTDGWTQADPPMDWRIARLPANSSMVIRYSADIIDDYLDVPVATVDNQVRVAPGYSAVNYFGPLPGDRLYPATDWAMTSLTLVGPNLELGKTVNDCTSGEKLGRAVIGQSTPWCLEITNSGDAPALAVDVTDSLPAGWTYDAGSAVITGAAPADDEPTVTTDAGASVLVWTVGDLAAGATVTVEFTATPGPGAPTMVTNEATAVAYFPDGDDADTDPDPAPFGAPGYQASSSAMATLSDHGLQITKSPSRPAEPVVDTGGPVTWTIVVSNPFDTDLTNVDVTDFVPDPLTYSAGTATSADGVNFTEVSVDTNGPGNTTEIVWTVDSLAGNDSFTIELVTAAPAGVDAGGFTNTVSATATEVVDAVWFGSDVELYSISSIGDTIWNDANSNGVQDPGEDGIDGVEVRLVNAAGDRLFRDPDTGLISTTQGTNGVALIAITGDDPSTTWPDHWCDVDRQRRWHERPLGNISSGRNREPVGSAGQRAGHDDD